MDLGLMDTVKAEYIAFKPSVNGWFIDSDETDLKGFLLDPESMKTGWGHISEGQSPDWQFDKTLGVKSERPTPEHKRGFSVMLYVKDFGWREWQANGVGNLKGMTALWSEIHSQWEKNKGKVVAISTNGSKAETIGKGTTRIPLFTIVDWRDKPEDIEPPKKSSDPDIQF
tara:strand:- start:14418 stop:14927 length:510 start_codon:yes stop_codon:yes gene_type:complete